jgi:transposase
MSVTNDDPDSLRNSTKYRQIAALATFVTKLKTVAPLYGIEVVEVPAQNTTTFCYLCGHTNPSSEKLENVCGGRGKVINQDVKRSC